GRSEVEPAVRDQEHRARHGGQGPGVGALDVVVDQLGDLLPDHRTLVGLPALADPPLEQLPADPGRLPLSSLAALWLWPRGAPPHPLRTSPRPTPAGRRPPPPGSPGRA